MYLPFSEEVPMVVLVRFTIYMLHMFIFFSDTNHRQRGKLWKYERTFIVPCSSLQSIASLIYPKRDAKGQNTKKNEKTNTTIRDLKVQ